MYDNNWIKPKKVGVPVISIGNLTLGGTGKTPVVAYVAQLCKNSGIISRGYGSKNGAPNDEALELAFRLPNVPHVQNPKRVKAAQQILAGENPPSVLVLDDAFQHRQIHRDLDIVLLDATEPFGYERIFPRGLLREPIASLKRADIVLLSRADLIGENERSALKERVKRIAPHVIWATISHRAKNLVIFRDEKFERMPLETLREYAQKRVLAVCGIGNPAAFEKTLKTLGLPQIDILTFPDHHNYTENDVAQIGSSAKGKNAVFCTMKDLVKLQRSEINGVPLYAVEIGIEFLDGEKEFIEKIQQSLF